MCTCVCVSTYKYWNWSWTHDMCFTFMCHNISKHIIHQKYIMWTHIHEYINLATPFPNLCLPPAPLLCPAEPCSLLRCSLRTLWMGLQSVFTTGCKAERGQCSCFATLFPCAAVQPRQALYEVRAHYPSSPLSLGLAGKTSKCGFQGPWVISHVSPSVDLSGNFLLS